MYRKQWGKCVLESKYTKDEFIDLYKNNSVTDLAKMMRVSRQTVISMAHKYGLPHKPKGGEIRKHKTITIDVKELEKLYKTTKTKVLAKRLKVSVATLVKILKQHGIQMKTQANSVRDRKLIVEG